MRKLIQVSTAIILAASSIAITDANAEIYSAGRSSCQTWIDLRASNRADFERNWIHGYVIALFDHEPYLASHDKEISEQAVYGWIDAYCKQNPLVNLRNVVKAMDADLKKRFAPSAQNP
jgi:hypothetical protein